MPIGLMNLLLRAGSKVGPMLGRVGAHARPFLGHAPKQAKPRSTAKDPLWRTRAAKPKDPKGGTAYGRPVAQPMGRINRLLYGPASSKKMGYTRAGLYGLGGAIAADRLHNAIFGEEKKAQVSGTQRRPFPSYEASPGFEDMESRQSWEARRHKKLNKDMHRLLQYYGIVNLVNPDQAAKMLELGSALVQQDIEMLGDERQAKIFDAVFSRGQLPRSAREAFDRVIGAKGTIDDAKEIAGIYADMAPSSSDLAKDERATQILQQADALIAAGYDSQAQQLILNAIYSKIIERVKNEQGVMELSPEQQAQIMVERRGGRKEGVEGGGGIEIEAA